MRVSGAKQAASKESGGWSVLPSRKWKDGDRVSVSFAVPVRLRADEKGNAGNAAVLFGPPGACV